MMQNRWDFSKRGWARVWVLTVLGTLLCIGVAFAVDSYSFSTGTWVLRESAINNLVIPLILAPPLLFFLLSKLRELAIAHHELMSVAATDSLTQLLNRRAFTAIVEGYLERVEARQAPPNGALVVIDVDHFKSVNDSHGHDAGDKALRSIAETIRAQVREVDIVGRMGGEEFSVFLPGATIDVTRAVSERVRVAVHDVPSVPDDPERRLSVSAGGVVFARPTTFPELYRLADAQLYTAKDNGRDRCEIAVLDAAGARAGETVA
ncbi:GGDEF domain-containing protein [Pelagibacterium halotolerans]|uniref:GGDEF domain-containing protein n=1 Tax=Pelagibacterium halotolerans TaxID=531813 RepID=UPI00384FB5F5